MHLDEVSMLVHQLDDSLILLLVLHVERLDWNLGETKQLLEDILLLFHHLDFVHRWAIAVVTSFVYFWDFFALFGLFFLLFFCR